MLLLLARVLASVGKPTFLQNAANFDFTRTALLLAGRKYLSIVLIAFSLYKPWGITTKPPSLSACTNIKFCLLKNDTTLFNLLLQLLSGTWAVHLVMQSIPSSRHLFDPGWPWLRDPWSGQPGHGQKPLVYTRTFVPFVVAFQCLQAALHPREQWCPDFFPFFIFFEALVVGSARPSHLIQLSELHDAWFSWVYKRQFVPGIHTDGSNIASHKTALLGATIPL